MESDTVSIHATSEPESVTADPPLIDVAQNNTNSDNESPCDQHSTSSIQRLRETALEFLPVAQRNAPLKAVWSASRTIYHSLSSSAASTSEVETRGLETLIRESFKSRKRPREEVKKAVPPNQRPLPTHYTLSHQDLLSLPLLVIRSIFASGSFARVAATAMNVNNSFSEPLLHLFWLLDERGLLGPCTALSPDSQHRDEDTEALEKIRRMQQSDVISQCPALASGLQSIVLNPPDSLFYPAPPTTAQREMSEHEQKMRRHWDTVVVEIGRLEYMYGLSAARVPPQRDLGRLSSEESRLGGTPTDWGVRYETGRIEDLMAEKYELERRVKSRRMQSLRPGNNNTNGDL
eukprot:c117_g1_i1.p1 GENE.c117_g1_i1~~c117_g1_i1.p1  ORF type:complete len:348 (-),score=44.20 c117_g1_i1:35-1078(-)